MATIEIPQSLRAYYDNDNKAVRRAVDELVGNLHGADMPDCDWSEAKNYNRALLMATQVRTDYVALLFKVWEITFGGLDLKRLGAEIFNYEQFSPSKVWENKWLWRTYYRNGNPDEDGRSDELCVYLLEGNLELRVYRYNEDGNLDDPGTLQVEGWSTRQDNNEEGPYLGNESANVAEFFSKPDSVIDRFAEDAAKVVQVLLKT